MDPIPDIWARDGEGLSRIFRYYAEIETPRMNSPVYTEYCTEVAADRELLSLASQINRGQPAPNILFAAVQDLLLEDPEASPEARALAVFYPAISDRPIAWVPPIATATPDAMSQIMLLFAAVAPRTSSANHPRSITANARRLPTRSANQPAAIVPGAAARLATMNRAVSSEPRIPNVTVA